MQFSVPTFPKLALMLSVTGLLTGLLISALVTPRYVSEAELELKRNVAGFVQPGEYLLQLEQEVFSRTSLDPGTSPGRSKSEPNIVNKRLPAVTESREMLVVVGS